LLGESRRPASHRHGRSDSQTEGRAPGGARPKKPANYRERTPSSPQRALFKKHVLIAGLGSAEAIARCTRWRPRAVSGLVRQMVSRKQNTAVLGKGPALQQAAGCRAPVRCPPGGGSADVGQDAVQLVEAVVADHQPALAARGVLDGHLGTELVGQLLLEALYIRVAVSARLASGRRRAVLQASHQPFCVAYRERPLDDDRGHLDLLP